MVYARDSKSRSRKGLWVQVPPMAPLLSISMDPLDIIDAVSIADDIAYLSQMKKSKRRWILLLVAFILAAGVGIGLLVRFMVAT